MTENGAFRSFFENMPSPLCSFDETGNILFLNKPFESLLGVEEKEVKGGNFIEMITHEALSARLQEAIQSVFRGERINDIHWKVPLASGEPRHFSLSMFPISRRPGHVSFGIAILVDITQRKALEHALVQTEKMAALGTLATGLAHEIGTPMNVILGRAESLLRHTQEEKTAKGLMIIVEQIDRMTHLIERLLAFARRKPIKREQIDINRLIKKGIQMLEQQVKAKGIVFTTALDPSLPLIWGDGEQILQVFVNLFMNAIDAMFDGGEIKIQSFLTRMEQAKPTQSKPEAPINQMVQILLKDSGCGVDAVHLDNIFDPFFTTKPVGKGTGLGLAVAHGIIREHGGQIEISSAIGEGTTFCIRLPAEPASNSCSL